MDVRLNFSEAPSRPSITLGRDTATANNAANPYEFKLNRLPVPEGSHQLNVEASALPDGNGLSLDRAPDTRARFLSSGNQKATWHGYELGEVKPEFLKLIFQAPSFEIVDKKAAGYLPGSKLNIKYALTGSLTFQDISLTVVPGPEQPAHTLTGKPKGEVRIRVPDKAGDYRILARTKGASTEIAAVSFTVKAEPKDKPVQKCVARPGKGCLILGVINPLGKPRNTHVSIRRDGKQVRGAWTNHSPFKLPPGSYEVRFGYALGILREVNVVVGKTTIEEVSGVAGRLKVAVADALGKPRNTHISINRNGKQVVGAWTNHGPFDLPPGRYEARFGYALGIRREVNIAVGKTTTEEVQGVAGRLRVAFADALGKPRDAHVSIRRNGKEVVGAWTNHGPFDLPPGRYEIRLGYKNKNFKRAAVVRVGQVTQIKVMAGAR